MALTDYHLAKMPCPACGRTLDGALGGDTRPKPGDVTVCIDCEALLEFGEGDSLHRLDLAALYACLNLVRSAKRNAPPVRG